MEVTNTMNMKGKTRCRCAAQRKILNLNEPYPQIKNNLTCHKQPQFSLLPHPKTRKQDIQSPLPSPQIHRNKLIPSPAIQSIIPEHSPALCEYTNDDRYLTFSYPPRAKSATLLQTTLNAKSNVGETTGDDNANEIARGDSASLPGR